jgi:hypothetical protein
MSETVAGQLVGVLEQIGVKHIFGLIGDSLNPLADEVRRSQIEWIGVRHEEGAALAAAGQAKLTGQLAVCAGTTGPGSNHLNHLDGGAGARGHSSGDRRRLCRSRRCAPDASSGCAVGESGGRSVEYRHPQAEIRIPRRGG